MSVFVPKNWDDVETPERWDTVQTVRRLLEEIHPQGNDMGMMKQRGTVEPKYEVVPQPVTTVGPDRSESLTRRVYKTATFPGCLAEGMVGTAPRASSGDVSFKSLRVAEPPRILAEGTER